MATSFNSISDCVLNLATAFDAIPTILSGWIPGCRFKYAPWNTPSRLIRYAILCFLLLTIALIEEAMFACCC